MVFFTSVAPFGAFVMRLYWPKEEALKGQGKPPQVVAAAR